TSNLPEIIDPVEIDGGTVPGQQIELNGTFDTDVVLFGLRISAPNSTVMGLAIVQFGYGIFIQADSVSVTGNFIGTDFSGAAGLGNCVAGISISSGNGEVIRNNTIAGNDTWGIFTATDGSLVQGNHIGVVGPGDSILPNQIGIHITGSNNIIGGTGRGEG